MKEFFRGWLSNSQSSRRGAQPFLTHEPFKKSSKPNELTTLRRVYTKLKQSVIHMYHFHSCISAGKNTKAKSLWEIIVILFDFNFGHCNMLWRWMKTCWYEMWWYCTWNTKILSGIFEDAAFYFDTLRDVYEAYVIYNFVALFLAYMGGASELVDRWRQDDRRMPTSYFWSTCCLSKCALNGVFLRRCLQGVLQFMVVKLILTVGAIVTFAVGRYDDGEFKVMHSNKATRWVKAVSDVVQSKAYDCDLGRCVLLLWSDYLQYVYLRCLICISGILLCISALSCTF